MSLSEEMRKIMNLLESKNEPVKINTDDWSDEQWKRLQALFDIEVTDASELDDMGFVPPEVFDDLDDDDFDTPFETEERILHWIEQTGTAIASIEDQFGWDMIYVMPDGKAIYPDRNSGAVSVASNAKDVIHGLKEFY
jgi:hypothetical protein